MECDICGKHPSARLPFNCTTCARSTLYPLRIEHAAALLQKEDMGRRVEAVVMGESTVQDTVTLDGALVDIRDCAKAHRIQSLQAETTLIDERIQTITEKAKAFREQIEEHKKIISGLKAAVSQRKSDAESANYGLNTRSAAELDTVQKSTRRIGRRWDLTHQDIVRGRISLCREAARLAGLRSIKKVEGQTMREHWEIGKSLKIFDLREMNGANPEVLTASLTQLAYLVLRVSTYLALRLPAEIVLPHKDYPLPTIFSPASSYLGRDVPYPGSTPSHSSTNSPTASRAADQRPLPRPRTLSINRPLPKLHKEDPAAFSIFVEGITLLAWDIAWLCRTQGMGGLASWTDVCSVGRNIHQLLLTEQRPAARRAETNSTASCSMADGATARTVNTPVLFGQFSHGAAHSFFGGSEGTELLRSWRLHSPARCIDKIKSHLIGEMQGAEWEMLQEKEWSDFGEANGAEEEAVLVKGRRYSNSRKAEAKTAKSGSGWTRLRQRASEEQSNMKSSSNATSSRSDLQ